MPGHRDDDELQDWSFLRGHLGFMFPEILAGPGLLIASPVWLISLLRQSAFGAATCLAVGAIAGAAVMAFGFARRSRAVVHLALLVLVATGALTAHLAPAH